MTPTELHKLLTAVLLYGWPWEIGFPAFRGESEEYTDWQKPDNQTPRQLFRALAADVLDIRLDPSHVWEWPIERRTDILPSWVRWIPTEHSDKTWTKEYPHDDQWWGVGTQRVAVNPLSPDTPPPSDWKAEGRRVLK